jgi:Ca-activated chloride channel family protein
MKKMKSVLSGKLLLFVISACIIFTVILSSSCGPMASTAPTSPTTPGAPAAESPSWQQPADSGFKAGSPPPSPMQPGTGSQSTWPSSLPQYESGEGTIGLATGGAKDIDNFRQNIEKGYMPLPTDITCEGLYYDYHFDTGQTQPCNKLFCPSYSTAVSRDPFSGKKEYYLSVGLNSGLKESDFERKKLNLVIVLDVSGSMSSPFDEYYYDWGGNRVTLDYRERDIPKIEVAKDALQAIMQQLNDDDYFSIVLFNERAHLLQPFKAVDRVHMEDVEDEVYQISPGGSTSLSAGMKMATEILNDVEDDDPFECENRIIILTDAMPNTGEFGKYSLLNMLKDNAGNNIYTTFMGIGVDFNSELVEYITKTRGANYYSVHSPGEFVERVENEFDYMVTPLVFNLRLKLKSGGWDIAQVYGSPEADKATGELMKINTMFPSEKVEGETRGGLVLLKLKKTSKDMEPIELSVIYEDRGGNEGSSKATINFEEDYGEYFDNSGIQKGILLARYADLMQDWLVDERDHMDWEKPWNPCVNSEDGIVIPHQLFSTWERQSLPLRVSYQYRSIFQDFTEYFAAEADDIADDTLNQELDILEILTRIKY